MATRKRTGSLLLLFGIGEAGSRPSAASVVTYEADIKKEGYRASVGGLNAQQAIENSTALVAHFEINPSEKSHRDKRHHGARS